MTDYTWRRFTIYYIFTVVNSTPFYLVRMQLTILSYELGWFNSFKTETLEANVAFDKM